MRSDNILNCHLVILERAPQDVTMYPTYGACCHIHFQFLRVNKEKSIHCNYETKRHSFTIQV